MTIEQAIRSEFPGKSNAGLRAELRLAAQSGSVMGLANRIALTTSGRLGLQAVQAAIVQAAIEAGR